MHKLSAWMVVGLLLLAATASRAEEFVLKDGSKIMGRMVRIKGETIEVETLYGKIKVSRGNITQINFPENQPKLEAAREAAEPAAPAVEHSLEGSVYTNRTGGFTLKLPSGWTIAPEKMRKEAEAIAFLVSDEGYFVAVTQENFSPPLRAYREMMDYFWKSRMPNFEKISETRTTVDGAEALLVEFRAAPEVAAGIPLHFLVAILKEGEVAVRIGTWSVEPMFKHGRQTLEQIISSYHKIREPLGPLP